MKRTLTIVSIYIAGAILAAILSRMIEAQNSVMKEIEFAPEMVTWGEQIQAHNGRCVGNKAVIIYPTLKTVIPGNHRVTAVRIKAGYCEGGQWVEIPVVTQ